MWDFNEETYRVTSHSIERFERVDPNFKGTPAQAANIIKYLVNRGVVVYEYTGRRGLRDARKRYVRYKHLFFPCQFLYDQWQVSTILTYEMVHSKMGRFVNKHLRYAEGGYSW